jgi:hypothetical protein
MPVPDFSPGEVLTAAAMDSIGLWLVKTQTVGTGVSSVTVTDAFSSTYDNYRILYSGGVGSTLISLALQIGGSTTGYYGVTNFATFAAGTPSAAADNNASFFNSIGYASTGFTQISLDLLSPNLARWTTVANASWAAGTVAGSTNGTHQVATAFTSFTISVNTGNITGGTIRVYGYRN